jgi:hypothetical protein
VKRNLILDKDYIVGYSLPSRGAGVDAAGSRFTELAYASETFTTTSGNPDLTQARLEAGWIFFESSANYEARWLWPAPLSPIMNNAYNQYIQYLMQLTNAQYFADITPAMRRRPHDPTLPGASLSEMGALAQGSIQNRPPYVDPFAHSGVTATSTTTTTGGSRDASYNAWKLTGRAPHGGWYGHPCLPAKAQLSHSPKADFFRLAMGNYWGFEEGLSPGTFNNFKFLRELSPAGSVQFVNSTPAAFERDNFIPYRSTITSIQEQLPATTADITAMIGLDTHWNLALSYSLLGKWSPQPVGHAQWRPSLAIMQASFPFQAKINTHALLPIGGSSTSLPGLGRAWLAGSVHMNIDPYAELRTFTTDVMAMYLMGQRWTETAVGIEDPFGAGLSATALSFQGILGRHDEAQGFGVLKRSYYDHAHEIFTPYFASSPVANNTSTPVKVASLTSNYYFAAAGYDEAIDGIEVDERQLPNTYILQEAIGYNPAHADNTAPVAPTPPVRAASFLSIISQADQNITSVESTLATAENLVKLIAAAFEDLSTGVSSRRELIEGLDLLEAAAPSKEGAGALSIPRMVKQIFIDHGEPAPPLPPPAVDAEVHWPPWYGFGPPDVPPAGSQDADDFLADTERYEEWVWETVIEPALATLQSSDPSAYAQYALLDPTALQGMAGDIVAASVAATSGEAPESGEMGVTVITQQMLVDPARDVLNAQLAARPVGSAEHTAITQAAATYVYDQADAHLAGWVQTLTAMGVNVNTTGADLADYILTQQIISAEASTGEAAFQVEFTAYTAAVTAYNEAVQAATLYNSKLLSNTMYGLYSDLSTFEEDFLPQNLTQISNVPYTFSAGQAWRRAKTPYLKKFAAGIKNLGATAKANAVARNSHIGFSQNFMTHKINSYAPSAAGSQFAGASPSNMPYNINVKFDTNIARGPGLSQATEPQDFMVPSYQSNNVTPPEMIDYLLHNIMIANIAGGYTAPNTMIIAGRESFADILASFNSSIVSQHGAQPENVFQHFYPMCAKIDDVDAGEIYYGFEWAEDSHRGTGFGGERASAVGAGGYVEPWKYSDGPYLLRAIDVPLMLSYTDLLKISDAPITNAPNPEVGQWAHPDAALAFGKGLFVGNQNINITPGSNKVSRDNALAAGEMVISDTNFTLLIEKLSDLITHKQRQMNEILEGKLAYSEIIAFKVCKHKVDLQTNDIDPEPLQNLYFPNSAGIAAVGPRTEISYYDTQVKYGHKYAYRVYAYTLVIGDQYNYNNANNAGTPLHRTNQWPGESNLENSAVNIISNQWPSVQIIEEPYIDLGIMMVADLPPPMPEIEVVPFRAINDKIRFLIQRQEGSYAINPDTLIINPDDLNKYNNMRIAQSIPLGAPILFATDNIETVSFEIYRIDTKPTSYRDFEGSLLAVPNAITPEGSMATEYAYDDTTIVPNKKYYYTFRSVDPHGQLSTPTPVYEIELVDDNGRIYPIVDIVHMSPAGPPTTTTKPLRKLMQIDAAFPQQAVNTTGIDSTMQGPEAPPPSPILNTQAEGIWSPASTTAVEGLLTTDEKVFKIRVSSKQTGKKLDLNVRFIENAIANPHEQD